MTDKSRPNERNETDIPKGSYAAGERVKLPRRRQPPSPSSSTDRADGKSCRLRGRDGEIVFTRQIVKEKVGTGRWLAMYLGLFGTYRKNETIDLQSQRGGKIELVSDLAIAPYRTRQP